MKNIHIFGGGTVAHISNHFAVCAPAYGKTAKQLVSMCLNRFGRTANVKVHLTKMAAAGPSTLETNQDVAARIEELKADPNTKIIFFNCALVDWEPTELFVTDKDGEDLEIKEFGKYIGRLDSRDEEISLWFGQTKKIIKSIRKDRKDIFLVGFKTTCGASKQEMYEKGLRLCKEGSVNLVLVNDTKTHWNMIVTPEEAAYHETDNREEVLRNLVDMTYYRSHLTFTQSTVVEGKPVSWSDERIPNSIRQVVNYCIKGNAYKPFNGATVGHFAVKLSDTEFLTSIRKSNFNDLDKNGMVYVKTDGPDTVLTYGAKPSVGGQSQRIVFREHEGMDCIVHFHSPLRDNHPDKIPVVSQREVECGSHQCGKNTSDNLKEFIIGAYEPDTDWALTPTYTLKAVMLDKHGPNIVFNKDTPSKYIINFIERNFDLSKKTGGYQI